jgi:predicted metal-dependent peptidase
LHEVLHAALLRVLRRGVRDAQLWNIAADIVVNGIVHQQGCFELPPGGIRDRQLEHLRVEEIYELLEKQVKCPHCLNDLDLLGSIDNQQLKMFLSEVQGILNSYPHLECELYYADAEVYGAYEINPDSDIPQPQGGGGTSFVPFFERISDRWNEITTGVCVYLTDGYGTFTAQSPELPVLWVITPGGLDLSQFPFGETVRLSIAVQLFNKTIRWQKKRRPQLLTYQHKSCPFIR